MIDIGGPAMVRAAAKNHAHVGVVVDPGRLRRGPRRARPERRRCRRPPDAPWRARPSPTPPPTTPPSSPGSTRRRPTADADAVLPPTLHLALERAQDAALRREPAPAGRPLPAHRRPVVVGRRRAVRRQGAVVPQPVRRRSRLAARAPPRRRARRRRRQARQPVRRRRGRRHRHRVPPGPRGRPGVGLRRHRGRATGR